MSIQPPQLAPAKALRPLKSKAQGLGQRVWVSLQERAERYPLQFWAVVLILVSTGVGFGATTLLLKLPKSPQCSRMFWPVASASMRLYCAQLAAEEKTVDSLLQAIKLVDSFSPSHPLYAEANRKIEDWAEDILDLAEETYQEGKLQDAIAIARRIPDHVEAYKVVEERIAQWQETWAKGEAIYAEVEADLRKTRWNDAFRNAVRLLNLDNRYWETVKYDEAIKNIQIAQEESAKLNTAFRILRRGGLDNWLKAIEEGKKIPKQSYAYEEAQNLISQAKEKLTGYVNDLIDDRDWQTLNTVVSRLPEGVFGAEDLNDWQLLATAGSEAQLGSLEGIQTAIASLERFTDQTRPHYELAQTLLQGWRSEEAALSQLAKARDTAASGNISDLNAAIAQAQQITPDNPRYQDARRDIANWTKQVQISEDRPLLSRAREMAASGAVGDLEQAIQQAKAIGENRALYNEARQEIQEWRSLVQKQEDQPILDQAQALANSQNYNAAISAAQQIQSGRALSGEAQRKIRSWRQEIQSQTNLQQAYALAASRSADALSQAINLVRQIPYDTEAGSQRIQALNSWSYQLLSIAQEKASISAFSEAIRLARMIPRESAAYSAAQDLVQEWRALMAPPPQVDPEPPAPLTPETSYEPEPTLP